MILAGDRSLSEALRPTQLALGCVLLKPTCFKQRVGRRRLVGTPGFERHVGEAHLRWGAGEGGGVDRLLGMLHQDLTGEPRLERPSCGEQHCTGSCCVAGLHLLIDIACMLTACSLHCCCKLCWQASAAHSDGTAPHTSRQHLAPAGRTCSAPTTAMTTAGWPQPNSLATSPPASSSAP